MTQLAVLRQREQMLDAARQAASESKTRTVTPQQAPPAVTQHVEPTPTPDPQLEPGTEPVQPLSPPPMIVSPRGGGSSLMPAAIIMPQRVNNSLEQRYREAIRAQQDWLRRLQGQ